LRKLKLQVQMSMDGYIAGPNGELDWLVWNWDDKLKNYVDELTESIDTILLGRKMTEGFISHWTDAMSNPDSPEYAFAKIMVETPKIVFTKTLTDSKWANTNIATGELTDEINKLKRQNGKDIIVYGGASFDASLIKEGLIDEYHLFVNPTAIGNGMPLFKDLTQRRKFTLVKSTAFDCGIAVLNYRQL
jgi:dihydrofolate reductase